MTVTSNARPGGLPARLLGILFILLGLALLGLGIKLATLGGSLYYLGGGVLLALSGYLLCIRRASGVWVYAFFLVVSTAWAVLEVQFDWWQLVPRPGAERPPQAFIMQRRQGYRDTLQRHGLPFHDAYLRCVNPTRRAGYQAMLDLLALPEPPTAIVMDGNVHGDGAVAALQQAGRLSGSHPIALVMYDGLPQDSLTDFNVTAIEQATREQVGEQIASMMQALIAGESVENLQVLWQPTLRLGKTSFPA